MVITALMAAMPIPSEPPGTLMPRRFTPLLIELHMLPAVLQVVPLATIVTAPLPIPDRSIIVPLQPAAPKTAATVLVQLAASAPTAKPLIVTGSRCMNPGQPGHPLKKIIVIAIVSVVAAGPKVPGPEGMCRPQA